MTAAKKHPDFQTGFFDVSEDDYHRDPCLVPSLSATCAWTIVNECPAQAWLNHPRFGGMQKKPQRHFDFGHVVHRLSLGRGKDFAMIDAPNWKSPKTRDAADLFRLEGKVPILKHELDDAMAAANAIRERMKELRIKLTGKDVRTEVCAMWVEEASDGTKVQCRAMFDYLRGARIVDVKTCPNAHPRVCQRHSAEFGYALKEAAYRSALRKIRPELAGRDDMLFLFVSTEHPHFVTQCKLTPAFGMIGERQWRKAVNTWAACVRDDAWPDYCEGNVLAIEPPRWLEVQEGLA